MSYCSPASKNSAYTCFDFQSLKKIAMAYNNEKATSTADKIVITKNTTKKELWDAIMEKMHSICFNNEWCWIDQSFVKKLNDPIIDNLTFRPPGPQKYEWLKTNEINEVLKQYEALYPHFAFYGPFPIDFEQLNVELNNIDLAKMYKNGKRCIGVVYNLDPHDKPGSHWVALFIDLNNMTISYYDSYGEQYPKQIQSFINKLNKKAKTMLGRSFHINFNTNQHQYGGSECGIFSIYFILRRLQGDSMDAIINNTPSDKAINKFRKVFFRPQ
jgi:hypothetical protein